MDYAKESIKKHLEWQGKIEVVSRVPINTQGDLSLAYTPGVAAPCLEIAANPKKSFVHTRRANLVAVVTDGTAVLGLGDIGPEAAMPVMEGKAVLFKALADVDAIPLCIASKCVDEIVNTVRLLAPSFGGINLEDISAPRCFEIEKKLKTCCDIPIFHDDQHGTAIVTLAAVINSLKLTGKKESACEVVISGAGAAGVAVARLLADYGIKNIVLCDREGAIYKIRPNITSDKLVIANEFNPANKSGTLADCLHGADIFIGLSAGGCVSGEMIASMNKNPIVFPMANPTPEIMPDIALRAGAAVVGTGRSDFNNQINNALAFPGVFRGALDAGATDINEFMKLAAAIAIADFIPAKELAAGYIIPSPLNREVAKAVAAAVAKAAKKSGAVRR